MLRRITARFGEHSTSSPANLPRDYTRLIVVVFTLIWTLSIHSRAYSSNDASRLASIDSLVERGTWAIDESRFLTVDKIKVGDHFYSDKPPLLSYAGAGLYSILHQALGLTLQPDGCDAQRSPTRCRTILETSEADWAYFLLTLLLVSSPATLILVLIYRLARSRGFSNFSSLLFITVLGLGTAMWPYSTVFTNHVPAAAAALVGLYVLLTHNRSTRGQLMLIGFSSALAAAIDPSTGIFAVGYFLLCVRRSRSLALWFVVGAIVPVAITLALNYPITGTVLLPQMVTAGYNYPGSEFAPTVAGNQRAADVPSYVYNLLIGQRGVFLFFPIVAWYLLATVRAARSIEPTVSRSARMVLACSLIYFLYFALYTDNYGGYAFSPRWLLNPVPLLAVFAVADPSVYRPRWPMIILGVCAIISIYEAYQGVLDPWRPAFPDLRLALVSTVKARPAAVAMSGYASVYELPDDARESFGSNDSVPRKFDATRSLVIPSGQTWWFINGRTPLAPEIAQPLGLNLPPTATLQSDLDQPVKNWLATFAQTALLDVGTLISLPVTFNGELDLLGYQIQRGSGGFNVITAWRIRTQPLYREQRKVSFDWMSGEHQALHHLESFGVQYDSLQSGDVVIHVRWLSTPIEPLAQYALHIGIVDPDTGTHLMTGLQTDYIALDLNEAR
jgi:hypothetical protein